MNQYSEAVNYLASYVRETEPIFAVQQGRFDAVQGQLEHALNVLKDSPDYEGEAIQIN